MKRWFHTAILVLLVGLLVACAPKVASPGSTGNADKAVSRSPLNTNYENALPVLNQLMVGTFKLEGSDQAVTASQAGELAVLWKAYRSLSASDATSAVELDALRDQILETMTEQQLAAIADMRLTREDLVSVMQERGIGTNAGSVRGNLSPEQASAMQTRRAQGGGGGFAGPGGGGPPPGGFPGGFVPGGGQAPNAEQIATLQAQRGGRAGGAMMEGPLFEALVQLLESKG
jgi:hypothetical protein